MISNDVLSYYRKMRNGQEVKEFLREHIKESVALIEDLDNSRLNNFVVGILCVPNFKELVKLAIIFHDSGKAFYQTERNMKEDMESGEKYLSFIGHEFVSAYLADRFVKERRKYIPDYYSIVFAIYFHHHAMGVEKREKEVIKRLRKTTKSEFEVMKDSLRKVLEYFLENEDREVLRKCLTELSAGDLNNLAFQSIRNGIYERMIHRTDPRFRKLSLIVLQCLLVYDYMSASNRDNYESEFSRAISSFYEIWLGSHKSESLI